MDWSLQLHEDDVNSPGVLQGWWWKSLKISAAFVVVGSRLSSLPWPLRLPSPADPPPLCGLVSVRRPHSSFALAGLPPLLKGLSLISMPLGLLGLLLPNKHRNQDLLPCLPFFGHLCCPLSLLFLTICFSLYHPPSNTPLLNWFVSALPVLWLTQNAVSSDVCITPKGVLHPCLGSAFLVSFLCKSEVTRWREDSSQRLLMYAAGGEGIWCKSEGEGLTPNHNVTARTFNPTTISLSWKAKIGKQRKVTVPICFLPKPSFFTHLVN